MPQHQPSSPTDPANDAVTGSAESDGGENNGDGRKGYGKRELSTSKRAAQNRAAQVSGFRLGGYFSPRVADRPVRELFDSGKKAISRSSRNKSATIKS